MKKNVIILVIIVITFALLGLIGIQLYWISNALAVKESNFNRGASEAISTAIYKYNKLEMAHAMMKKQEQDRQVNRFFNVLDSLNREYYHDVLNAVNAERRAIDDQLAGWQGEFLNPFQEPPDNRPLNPGDISKGSSPGFFDDSGYADSPLSPSGTYNAFHEFFSRTKIVNDLFDDLFSNKFNYSPSSGRGIVILDSLLKSELDRQGIKTEYEFGVYDPVFNSLLAEKTGNHTQLLLESEYVFSLYPNDVFRNPEFLIMVFPKQKPYLMAQMNAMMAVSSILILVIISSFTYTIMTIIRQKKISVIKNDFINNMTHELKTPISTISLACQALRDQDVQKSETLYQSYINVINEENLRLGMMTEKVLQTAQIEKGKLSLNKSGFNLHDIIEDAIKKTSLQLNSRYGKIAKELQAEFSFLEADKVHLTNLIFNLLDNAIKYSPNNPDVKIITENTENGIVVHVEDKGIGISKANQKKIFENLYRVSTGNIHNVKGFGLGLSYVKAIVELHGGNVNIQSELKKGSRFSVFIPFGFEEHPVKKS